jgi:hypothetical protein
VSTNLRMSTSVSSAPRVISALVAVVLQLSATLGGAIHFALVRHERCPEHGELIHGSWHAAPAVSAGALRLEPLDDGPPRVFGAHSDDAQDSHDACALFGLTRQRWAAPGTASAVTRAVPAPAPAIHAPRPAPIAQLAALRLAPKTSPPTAAA